MKRTERGALLVLLNSLKHPSVSQASYTIDGDTTMTRTEHVPLAEASRRLKSDDYKAGWHACRAKVVDHLAALGVEQATLDLLDAEVEQAIQAERDKR